VSRLVTELLQKLDGLRREPGIGQKPHASGAERVEFILSQGCSIDERLADIFLFEVR
jgi:hypothetical protein